MRIMRRLALIVTLLGAGCAHVTHDLFLQGPQGRLHVEDGGRGSAVPALLVHGNGANLTQWRAQLPYFHEHLGKFERLPDELHGQLRALEGRLG